MRDPESGCAFFEALLLLAVLVALPLVMLFCFGGKIDVASGKVLTMMRETAPCTVNSECAPVKKQR